MKRTAMVIGLCLALIPTHSLAATNTPTPTAKATATAKASATPTPKATVKATPTKKPKKTKKPVAPSPSPKWPPAGFKVMDDVYWRTPSVEVMMNVAAKDNPIKGRLQVASLIGCVYWEVDSKVITPNPDIAGSFLTLGMLRTLAKKSEAKEVVTLVLPSGALYSGTIAVVPIGITCHQDPTTEKVPSNTYISR